MDSTMIQTLIGSYGFPIVACGYMMIVNNKTIKENTQVTNKMVSLLEQLVREKNE